MKGLQVDARVVFFVLILAGMLLSGCAGGFQFFQYNRAMEAEEMKQHISRLEEKISADNLTRAHSSSFLALALLYSHRNNVEPDYERALEMLERSISLDPLLAKGKNVQSLLSLLQRISSLNEEHGTLTDRCDHLTEKCTGLQRDSDLLKKNVTDLKAANELLAAKNQDLQNIIEQLKLLDIRLEEKRKNF